MDVLKSKAGFKIQEKENSSQIYFKIKELTVLRDRHSYRILGGLCNLLARNPRGRNFRHCVHCGCPRTRDSWWPRGGSRSNGN